MFKYLLLQQKLEETPKRVQFTQNTQNGGRYRMKDGRKQKTDRLRKCRVVGGGWGGGGIPTCGCCGLELCKARDDAFTLQLQNSCSVHLFSRMISSGLSFPGPLWLPHHWQHGHMVQLYHNNLHTEESNYGRSSNTDVALYCRVDDIKSPLHCNHIINWSDHTLLLHHCGHLVWLWPSAL